MASRREVLKAGVFAGVSLGAVAAQAQAMTPILASQLEWTEGFDASAPSQAQVHSARPTLSAETALYTEQALVRYMDIAAQGGWGLVPEGQVLKIGVRSPAVGALRQRLAISGDLMDVGGMSDSFDSFVDGAVRRFQLRHGLLSDGVVANATLKQLNTPVDYRLRQLETNLVRVRSMSGFLGDRYVMVNIPGAEIEAVEADIVHSRHQAVVGKIDRQTPLLNSKINLIKFNPFWTVPRSIIIKDLIPKMQTDSGYLDRQKIRIYDQRGNPLDWRTINWNSEEAADYLFRQDPGDLNSMGSVKIEFPSPEGVYMHDTPSKGLFGENARFHSSGCVRVQNVREYVYWILKNTPEWPQDRIAQAMTSGERIDAPVTDPVPLYFQYVTAWANSDGIVQFRDDIYQRDGLNVAFQ
ncbi:L,D-transpeptidase family protein [Mongoliimonas terrestris]|uniref:L,D-transpeptidase family protein n=1 Tax=Mongoliimonas terrestris TaxID=1709001 RepID=UPI00094984A7|nr:L,D-transpeptidase family protein [Mongoliimonas terrestris]